MKMNPLYLEEAPTLVEKKKLLTTNRSFVLRTLKKKEIKAGAIKEHHPNTNKEFGRKV